MKLLKNEEELNKSFKNEYFLFVSFQNPFTKLVLEYLKNKTINLTIINIENFPQLIKRFGIKKLPTLIFF